MKKTKKAISRFLNSEEGKILNSDVVKMGLTLGIVGAAAMTDPEIVAAFDMKHANYFRGNSSTQSHLSFSATIVAGGTDGNGVHINYNTTNSGKNMHSSHNAHASHGSHGSHSSHSSHGSHASHSSHGSHGSHGSHSSHGSHGSHGSHASHASHARGGWC